jgi:hypothetical protein
VEVHVVVHVDGVRLCLRMVTMLRCYISMESHGRIKLTGKLKNSERNMSHCHKSHMDRPGHDPEPPL